MKIMKRLASFGILSMFLLAGVTGVKAQAQQKGNRAQSKGIEFTDEQKAEMKEIRLEYAKATIDLKNELNELRARKRTLLSDEKPNQKEIYANIDKSSAINKQLMEQKMKMRLKITSLMTEEQKLKTEKCSQLKECRRSAQGKMGKGYGKHGKSRMGKRAQFDGGKSNKQTIQKRSDRRDWLDLSDEQKEQMKELKLAHVKDTKDLRNQAEELQLKQKHLMTADTPDEKQIMTNVDLLSDIRNKLAKMKVDHQLEARNILNDEQLTLFLSRPQMGKWHRKAHRGF